MPVVYKVHQDKDKLLSLFLQIDQDDVKEQLSRCREFFNTFNSDGKGNGNQHDDNNQDSDDEEKEDDDDNDGKSRQGKTDNSRGTPRANGKDDLTTGL